MPDILSPTGIEKPLGGEQHSRAMVNRNYDRINQIKIDAAKQSAGLTGQNKANVTNALNSGAVVMLDLVLVNLIVDHWYEVSYRFNSVSTNTNLAMSLNVKKSAPAVVDNTGTDIDDGKVLATSAVASQGESHDATFEFKATATEQVNLKACLQRLTGAVDINISQRRLVVKNIGAQI